MLACLNCFVIDCNLFSYVQIKTKMYNKFLWKTSADCFSFQWNSFDKKTLLVVELIFIIIMIIKEITIIATRLYVLRYNVKLNFKLTLRIY